MKETTMTMSAMKVEQYKGHPILCLPLGEGELKFGRRKAQAVSAHWDAVQAFATATPIPTGSPARIEDFKGQPILILPVDGEDEFRFGQRKAQTILSHQQVVQAFAAQSEPPIYKDSPSQPTDHQRRAAAFRKLADNMKKQIAEQRRPAFEGQRSTYRRERFRAAKAEEVRALEQVQDKLYALAAAWDQDAVPERLQGLTMRAQVERLVRYEIYPNPMAHADHLVRLLAETKGKRGTADARRIVEQILRRKESWFCRLYGREDMDAIDTLIKASTERTMYEKHLRGNYEAAYQLLKGGIDTPDTYRQAREALLALGDPQAGQKTLADIIADGVRQACPEAQIEVCEYQHRLRTILELKGYEVIGSDFLNLKPDAGYDTIVMNPPFENFQDVEHVRHAFECLNPGGRLVTVMGEGAFFRQDKIAVNFRQWLDDGGGYAERLPEGSFKASGTGVAARIVVLDKPLLQPVPQPTPEEKLEVFTQLSLF
jgi:hypothetical protein